MKENFIKILSLFFLTILLTSNILNLHVYAHQQDDNTCITKSCENENDEKDVPCELCLLALNLNDLDYNNTSEFLSKDLTTTAQYLKEEVLTSQEFYFEQIALNKNRNKAPPYFI